MREACLALLPALAVEYEPESRTLLPHHPDSQGCASDPRPVLPGVHAIRGPIDRHSSTISIHDIHFLVCRQPLANALCLPISQQIHNLVRLQVHEDAAEALAAPPTPIVNPNDAHLADLRERNQKQ